MRVSLSRRTSAVLLVIVLLAIDIVLTSSDALAATISVNTLADEATDNATCSLREAIISANTDSNGAEDACVGGAGADTITLGAGTYTLSVGGTGEDAAATGDLDVTDPAGLTIQGAGAGSTTVDADDIDRVFDVLALASLTISDLTVTDGQTPAVVGDQGGGGIRNTGILTVTNAVVTSNEALEGAGVFNNATLTLTGSTVSSNSSGNRAGAIAVDGGTVVITDSTLTGNDAQGPGAADGDVLGGGAMYTAAGTTTITGSTISSNTATAGDGGGFAHYGGTLTVTNSTLSGNQADVAGNGFGGGFLNLGATMTLTNVTLSSNSASAGGGGGIANTGTIDSSNTIVADHVAGGDCFLPGPSPITSGGGNLDSDSSCFPGGFPDQTADPLLGPLASNGGPTQTHSIGLGSPALDAGTGGGCPGTDQRGLPRPVDGDDDATSTCDVGAYEFQTAPPPPPPPPYFELRVVKSGNGTGTVASTRLDINCGTNCSASHPHNSSGVLTATPDDGSEFSGWSGPCSEGPSNTSSQCTIHLTGNRSVTASFIEAEPSSECSDGADNDGDGLTDFPDDQGCTDADDDDESGGGGTPACSDGADNDGDGLTDFPDDQGCTDADDDDESGGGGTPACSDGADNDGDGLTDFPDDQGCTDADDDDEVDIEEHERKLVLHGHHDTVKGKKKLRLHGFLKVLDGYEPCLLDQTVIFEKRVRGAWKFIASDVVDDDGAFVAYVRDYRYKYRASVAKVTVDEGPPQVDCLYVEKIRKKRHPGSGPPI